jgi:hypothetical protein
MRRWNYTYSYSVYCLGCRALWPSLNELEERRSPDPPSALKNYMQTMQSYYISVFESDAKYCVNNKPQSWIS